MTGNYKKQDGAKGVHGPACSSGIRCWTVEDGGTEEYQSQETY